MLIGIEESTDVSRPQAHLVKFRSERQACQWLAAGARYVDPAAADPRLAMREQNFHRWVRCVYQMPPRFRLRAGEVEALRDPHRRLPLACRQALVYRRHAVRQLD